MAYVWLVGALIACGLFAIDALITLYHKKRGK